MLFSEIYSVYYNTVAKILTAINEGSTEKDLQTIVSENAFADSVLTILPSLKSGKWALCKKELSPILEHNPTMPLTIIQKRWLKAISLDKRIKLFDIEFPELDNIKPLFTQDDYKIFDKYDDGDNYDDEKYIRNFRVIKEAIKNSKPVKIVMNNRIGNRITLKFYPLMFEYSQKDDKFRIVASGARFKRFNLGRIITAQICGDFVKKQEPIEEHIHELTLLITDERNAMERAMLHFAHFEKQAERIDDTHYSLNIKYYENDETEMVIRVLSFGPFVKVIEPERFQNLIKERLISQKSCEL